MSNYAPLMNYDADGGHYESMEVGSHPSGGFKSDYWGPLPRRTWLIGAAVAAGVLVVLAVALGVALSAAAASRGGVPLRASQTGELLVAEMGLRADGSPRIVARSYDGNVWERIGDQDFRPVGIECRGSDCNLFPKANGNPGGDINIRSLPVPDNLKSLTADKLVARLLLQTTFGATKDEIDATVTTYASSGKPDVATYVRDQMALPATSLRTYARERTHPRMTASTKAGDVVRKCEPGARYHSYAFNSNDELKPVLIEQIGTGPRLRLSIGGKVRTELAAAIDGIATYPTTRQLCTLSEGIGQILYYASAAGSCANANRIRSVNPKIDFSSTGPDNELVQQFAPADVTFQTLFGRSGIFVLDRIAAACRDDRRIADLGYLRIGQNDYYRYDPRLKLVSNTLDAPATGVAQACPSLAPNFVNFKQCKREAGCAPPSFNSAEMTLNQATIRAWYTDSSRYVYYVTGLRLESPFDVSACRGPSRWRRQAGNCANPTNLDTQTATKFREALSASTDPNPNVRDIELDGQSCTDNGASVGASITVNGECFTHVHPEEYSVRDFTQWAFTLHPGNDDVLRLGKPNPIMRWADAGGINIVFPTGHPMTRFRSNEQQAIPAIGRFGDKIDFQSLQTELQTPEMAARVGAQAGAAAESFLVCGAPGEGANNATLQSKYVFYDNRGREHLKMLDWTYDLQTGKSMVWANVALTAPDQLRQRVAWALAQIFTIADADDLHRDEVEIWTSFYDIFTRHAFGNYRNIMKEVTFHSLMAEYLTFFQSKSYAVQKSYPDENYAREIMQLFSIGLTNMHPDGSNKIAEDGDPEESYFDEDIVEFARIFTGFDRAQSRANIDQLNSGTSILNAIDPMQIKPAWRDWLPKSDLFNGYIGDGYALCTELPRNHWLHPGARFIYTGASSAEGSDMDAQNPATIGKRGRFAPLPASALYKKLCVAGPDGRCTFPREVVLDEILACTAPTDVECSAEAVVSVAIREQGQTRYYTYEPRPCVNLAFYGAGKLLKHGGARQCGDPARPFGSPVCCLADNTDAGASNYGAECLFGNERTTWATVAKRCEAQGQVMCDGAYNSVANWQRSCAQDVMQWVNSSCTLQVQVLPSGQVFLVDPAANNDAFRTVRESSGNVFRVRWADKKVFPNPDSPAGCPAPHCKFVTTAADNTCLCNITVVDTAVITAVVDEKQKFELPSVNELFDSVPIGAAPPASFGPGVYTQCTSSACTKHGNAVKVWAKNAAAPWAADTIFEFAERFAGAGPSYRMNRVSMVQVGGDPNMSFRNPPQFMPGSGELPVNFRSWRSDSLLEPRAMHETDALIDHLFYNNNTGPFVAFRLIQRMVTSNPSLRYVKAVSDAFKTGRVGDEMFSGQYGDLGAAVFAMLTDHEARTPIVEADPGFGVIREPLLKVMHLLRAFKIKTTDNREVMIPQIMSKIGQEAFRSTTVFGFYLPEYRPQGPVANRGLVAPEAQILNTPTLVKYLNGMTALIDNGLSDCDGGFGYRCSRNRPDGNLTYTPANMDNAGAVVSELDLILLQGRLNETLARFFVEEYGRRMESDGPMGAFRHALKMFMTTAEFQMTNANILSEVKRTSAALVTGTGRPFKAIVVVYLDGGCDSFNLLVPHSGCSSGDYFQEYVDVRGAAALTKTQLLSIPATSPQPCTTFGLHSGFAGVKQLYDQDQAALVANIGGLVEPLSVDDYRRRSGVVKQFPPQPSSHNIAQRTSRSVHAQNSAAKGVLGRMVDVLASPSKSDSYRCEVFSISGNTKILEGNQAQEVIDRSRGVVPFNQNDQLKTSIGNLTQHVSHSAFAETFSSMVETSLAKTEKLGGLLNTATIDTTFSNEGLSQQMQQVAKLIKIRQELGAERAVFYTRRGGFDTHFSNDLYPNFEAIDGAISKFAEEMKKQTIWNDVVVVTVSDFGRTITSNGQGTDHAWGGNQIIAGGGIKGGQIFGKFPASLKADGDRNLGGRGRLVPTMPWEGIWGGIADWFGVTAAEMDYVLPNHKNFPAEDLLDKTELFK